MSQLQFNYLLTSKNVLLSSNSYVFEIKLNMITKCMAWILLLLCKNCEFRERICYKCQDRIFPNGFFIGAPCTLYILVKIEPVSGLSAFFSFACLLSTFLLKIYFVYCCMFSLQNLPILRKWHLHIIAVMISSCRYFVHCVTVSMKISPLARGMMALLFVACVTFALI